MKLSRTHTRKGMRLPQTLCVALTVLCAAVLPLIVGKTTVFLCLKPDVYAISTDFYYFYKFCFFCVIGSLMALYILFAYFRQRDAIVLSKFYLAFVLLTLLSAICSINISNAFLGIAGRYQGFYVYFFYFVVMVFCTSFLSARHIKVVLYALLASAGVIAAIALLQFFGVELLANSPGLEMYGRYFARGTLGNRNFLGSYFTLLTPIAAVLFITAKTTKRAAFCFILSGLFFSGLVVSLTRVAWLGFAGFALIMTALQFKLVIKHYKRFIALLLLFILLFAMLTLFDGGRIAERGQDLTQQLQHVESPSFGSGRMFIYSNVLRVIARYPLLGTGPDCLGTALDALLTDDGRMTLGSANTYIDKAHSEFLEIAATMGIPAVLCFMLFFVFLLLPLLLRFKKLPVLIQAMFCGVGAYLVQAGGNIGVISVLPVFYVLAGILLKYSSSWDKFTLRRKTAKQPTSKKPVTLR